MEIWAHRKEPEESKTVMSKTVTSKTVTSKKVCDERDSLIWCSKQLDRWTLDVRSFEFSAENKVFAGKRERTNQRPTTVCYLEINSCEPERESVASIRCSLNFVVCTCFAGLLCDIRCSAHDGNVRHEFLSDSDGK